MLESESNEPLLSAEGAQELRGDQLYYKLDNNEAKPLRDKGHLTAIQTARHNDAQKVIFCGDESVSQGLP